VNRIHLLALLWLVASGLSHAADSGPALSSAGTRPGAGSIPQAYPHAVVKPVGLSEARITGGYLGAYVERTRDVSVLDLFGKMGKRGSFKNFQTVASGSKGEHVGIANEDEWVHKLVEAGAYFAPQSKAIDDAFQPLLRAILAAQDKDGYLNSFYQNMGGPEVRFQPTNRFEFYDFGHMAQAGIAWKLAAGDDRLFNASLKFADLLCDKFGSKPLPYDYQSDLAHKKYEHPNHEMAMVELYRLTGNRRYLDFAAHTLDCYKFWSFPEVHGHCVQENLLLCGGADVYLETGNPERLQHLDAMWTDITERKMYITGGVGNGRDAENYGAPYELPNIQNYCETCAAISKAFFDWRMLLATGQAKYVDDLERTFYNAVLSGVSLSGTEYFYTNHMEEPGNINRKLIVRHTADTRDSVRKPYFNTSCCAPNLHRLLGSLQQYLFTTSQDGIEAHLYGNAELQTRLDSGEMVKLRETTDYPRSGLVQFEFLAEGKYHLALRIPQWTEGTQVALAINGQPGPAAKAGEYIKIKRTWKTGDKVTLEFDLKPRLIAGRDRVADEKGKLVLMRGPVVYCLESPDNPQVDLFALSLATSAGFEEARSDVLGGTVRLTGSAWDTTKNVAIPVTAIPYHLWANRGSSTMRLWIPAKH
jgi:uncharacterized protein